MESELRQRHCEVIPVVLQAEEVFTDARFVSYRAGNAFISLPTAPPCSSRAPSRSANRTRPRIARSCLGIPAGG